MAWFLYLLAALALNIVAYLIMPKPKQGKSPAAKDLEVPVAESGKPIPVVFGTMTVKGMNILFVGDRSKQTYEIDAGGGG